MLGIISQYPPLKMHKSYGPAIPDLKETQALAHPACHIQGWLSQHWLRQQKTETT